jgi:hypothetical protein
MFLMFEEISCFEELDVLYGELEVLSGAWEPCIET